MKPRDVLEKVLQVRGGEPTVFKQRNNPDPKVILTRQLTAAAMAELLGDPGDDRILSALDCLPGFVEKAHHLAVTDREFRAELQKITGKEPEKPVEPVADDIPKPDAAPEKKGRGGNETVDEFLLRITQEVYGFDSSRMLIKRNNSPETGGARKVIAFIASEAFGRKPPQIQKLFDCELRTARYILGESKRAYSRSAAFKMHVNKLCNEYDVLLPA